MDRIHKEQRRAEIIKHRNSVVSESVQTETDAILAEYDSAVEQSFKEYALNVKANKKTDRAAMLLRTREATNSAIIVSNDVTVTSSVRIKPTKKMTRVKKYSTNPKSHFKVNSSVIKPTQLTAEVKLVDSDVNSDDVSSDKSMQQWKNNKEKQANPKAVTRLFARLRLDKSI